jgi:5-hydroxyisourate hydrolase-like protein (transthyretin family)
MKKFQNWVPICGAALVLGSVCHGQPVGGAARRGPAGPELVAPPGTISGTVRDPSGAPARGLPVTFYGGMNSGAPGYAETKTDDNGRYEIVLEHKQIGNGGGGIPQITFGPVNPTNCLMARDLARNLVAFQEFTGTPRQMDLSLKPGITLSGSVKNSAGAPLSNIALNVTFVSGHSFIAFMPRPNRTDAQGAFSIPALPQGYDYNTDEITAPGYGTAGGELRAGNSKTNRYKFPAFVLKPADRKLAGQVLGPDGKPVAGIKVKFDGVGQTANLEVPATDALGHFAFDAVCQGPVTVSAYYVNSFCNTTAHGGDTNVILRLGIINVNRSELGAGPPPPPPRKVAGTVRDPSGAPADGVTMSLFPTQRRNLQAWLQGQTDSGGRYEFNWQLNRDNWVADNGTAWLMARDPKRGLAAIHEVDAATTNLDLRLQEGLALSTRALDRNGRPVPSATGTVTIWGPSAGTDVGLQPIVLGVHPNEQGILNGALADQNPILAYDGGHLRFPCLPQGQRYGILVEAPGYTSDMLFVEGANTKTNALELRPAVLGLPDRIVAGRVLDVEGKPAASVELELFEPNVAQNKATTDSGGHFVFKEVSRGPVRIMAGRFVVNPAEPSYLGTVETTGGDTNVVLQVHLSQPFVPTVAFTASGTVFDPSGAPASGVLLSPLPSIGLNIPIPIQSDAGGKYRIQWQTLSDRENIPPWATLLGRDPAHNLAATAQVTAATTNLPLRLQPGLTLSGAVRDAAGKPLTNAFAQPILDTPVYTPAGDQRFSQYRLPPVSADAQGSFSISALPQGMRYNVVVTADGYGSNSVPVPASLTQTNRLQLPPTVLKTANRQLAGQVLGADGQPCWGASIGIRGDGQPAGRLGRSDANGHFVISGVCEGPVDLRAMLPASLNVPMVSGDVQVHGGDTNIVVKLGAAAGAPAGVPRRNGQAPANPPAATGPLL